MKEPNRFTSRTQASEEQLAAQETGAEGARNFATVEEIMRHDALHTPVPPSIAHRLQESIGKGSPPAGPWWRRLLR